MRKQFLQPSRKRCRIRRGYEESGPSAVKDCGHFANRAGDHGFCHQHRLQQGQRNAFRQGREHEHICAGEHVPDVRSQTEQVKPITHRQLLGPASQWTLELTPTGNCYVQAREARGE
jgi:hypothetical protein